MLPTASAISALRPVTSGGCVAAGFWGERLQTVREHTIRHAYAQLVAVGTIDNFRLAAGARGEYRALGQMFSGPFPFLDSDVYKWLEGVGWQLGRRDDAELAAMADEVIHLIGRAQRPDGYLNTFVQVVGGGRPYADLAWGHELYTLGHLVQAAIAWKRARGDDRLLAIAQAAVDHVHASLGPGRREALDGHPEIEMALVELYRTTGDRRHLDLASWMVDLRGRGIVGPGRFGSVYWQDHEPVREAAVVAGHAVRQLYLDCGAVDVAVETGDADLLDAVRRRWHDMVDRFTYLTGGVGSRHRDEAFGDPYELPPDQAYTETCAAIASVMLGWRLLLATGDPRAADVVERTLYNAVLPGLSLDGTSFFYVNPLQRRTHRAPAPIEEGKRQPWYACACCPPNIIRTLSSLEGYVASTDGDGLVLHQLIAGELSARVGDADVRLRVATSYPWAGRVALEVLESGNRPWSLSVRVPAWAEDARMVTPDAGSARVDGRLAGTTRVWRAGDRLEVELPIAPRITLADPRVDAIRGCVAVERGPLVYCVETGDLPAGVDVEDVRLPVDAQVRDRARPEIRDDVVGVDVLAEHATDGQPVTASAIPYMAWANRDVAAMGVWIPVAERSAGPTAATGAPGGVDHG